MLFNRRQFLVFGGTTIAAVTVVAVAPVLAEVPKNPTPDYHKGVGKTFLSKWDQNGWPPR